MKLAKQLRRFVVTAFETHRTRIRIDFLRREIRQHFLGWHIPSQIIFRHRTTTKTLNSAIVTTATCLVSSIDFLEPFIGSCMQMRTKLNARILRN